MSQSAPTPSEVLETFDALAEPGTPLTTAEVAAEFDCTSRTIYNKLDALVEDGRLETKKVGSRGRVWWRRPRGANGGAAAESAEATFRRLFENVPGRYLILKPDDYEIVAASDAYLEATMTGRDEILGETLFEVFPAGGPDHEGASELRASLDRVKARREEDVMPVTHYPIPQRGDGNGGFEDRWWTPINAPVFDAGGNLEYIVHRVEDVTPVVRQLRTDGDEGPLETATPNDSRLAADAVLRDDELRRAKERAHERLRESERRLDAFVTATTELVYRMSPDWTEMYELDGRGLLDDTDDPLDTWLEEYIPRDEQQRVRDAVDEAIESESTFELEHEVLRADGTRGWVESRAVPIRDEEGAIVEWFGAATDVTERKRIEHALRESEERFRAIANLVPDLMWSNDPDGSVSWYNQQWFEYTGQSHEDATEDGWLDAIHPADREQSLESFRRSLDEGEPFRHEHRIRRHDGEYRWFLARARPIEDDDGTISRWFGTATDIHDEYETKAALERLSAASQELIGADSGEIAGRVAEVAREVLGVEHAALWRYDETAGDLERYDNRVGAGRDVDAVEYPDEVDELAWDVFVGDELAVARDPSAPESGPGVLTLRSKVLIPLGRHGVLCGGSPRPEAVDERTVDIAETIGATVESAWDRAEGEHQLAERNEELERLDALNTLIRGIDRALVEADSLEAIDAAVCEHLAEADRYEFAWVGDRDPGTGAVTPREFAGVDRGYLETLPTGIDERQTGADPIAEAARTGELRVVSDVAIDPRAASWREATLERGARSCIAIPLVYNGSRYGVLAVYASRPQPDARDHAVFGELGRTIAHALNAVETKRTLLTDSVIELTIDVREPADVLSRLAREADCEIEFEGLVPRQGDTARLFFRATGADPEPVRTAASRVPTVAEIQTLSSGNGEYEFEATVTGGTLASHVVENGGVVRSLTATDEGTTLVVDLPAADSARTFVETVREEYTHTDLVSRRTRDRPITTREDLRDVLDERFTDRQREVLETAYRSGFFESPRVRTGRELSEALDIAQPTFSHHLREAQRRLCELAFENA
ncbi:PAS/PAC sensor protein [Natronococcus amylolyticus DSM 10524]|uniref:histidine kinase n=1 Tax=Natronococcus amylolyticus DSM 10524 TaxID=1227497 RepID=L9XEV2_9EURY|nr:bacterio-opsin activator domain-containing protein [Natronococcus amylolyticus]ELY60142.1 PAS/PAC sensor protein [Natronococcus amylolyticus DSM 10524]